MKAKQAFSEYATRALGPLNKGIVVEILVERLLDAESSNENKHKSAVRIQVGYEAWHVKASNDSRAELAAQWHSPEFALARKTVQKTEIPNPEVAWLMKLLEMDIELGQMYRKIDLLLLSPRCGRALLPWLMLTDLDYPYMGLGIRAAQLGSTASYVGLFAEDVEQHYTATQLDVIANYCLHCALNGEKNAVESFTFWKTYLKIAHA